MFELEAESANAALPSYYEALMPRFWSLISKVSTEDCLLSTLNPLRLLRLSLSLNMLILFKRL